MITPDDNPDYITVINATPFHTDASPGKKLVVVMHYHKANDEYIQTRCSSVHDPQSAQRVAENWAAAMKLEIR